MRPKCYADADDLAVSATKPAQQLAHAEKIGWQSFLSAVSDGSTAASVSNHVSTGLVVEGEEEQQPLSFEEKYELQEEVLGTGFSGSVLVAICRQSGRRVAVKSYAKAALEPFQLERMRSELELHGGLPHPNVVKVEDVIETEDTAYLVMEALEGGEVFDRLASQKRFSESEAADVIFQTLFALSFLHARKVAHRDVKLENLLYSEKDGKEVRLIDFGFASKVGAAGLTDQCGSVGFVAPEVLLGGSYDERCDVWSVGSTLHLLLVGRPLFEGKQQEVLVKTRDLDELEFRPEFFDLSEEAQDLLRALLCPDPERRISAQKALAHPWFRRVDMRKAKMKKPRPSSSSDWWSSPSSSSTKSWFDDFVSEAAIAFAGAGTASSPAMRVASLRAQAATSSYSQATSSSSQAADKSPDAPLPEEVAEKLPEALPAVEVAEKLPEALPAVEAAPPPAAERPRKMETISLKTAESPRKQAYDGIRESAAAQKIAMDLALSQSMMLNGSGVGGTGLNMMVEGLMGFIKWGTTTEGDAQAQVSEKGE